MKCLVVDDSATMRRIVVNALNSIGIADVVEAGGGSDALEKVNSSIDLIITDWGMPPVGGLDLIRAVRATTATPILVVTTRSRQEDIMQAVNAGGSGYIRKPFTPQDLKDKIRQIMAAV